MKKGILLLLLLSSVFANAQSLKEALYSGKLKNQPGTVIRKGDDLTTKIDTVQKAPISDTSIAKGRVATMDSSIKKATRSTDSTAISAADEKDVIAVSTDSAAALEDAASISKEKTVTLKDNNVLLKEYIDSVTSTLKTEVLPSKKIKRGDYYVTVSYAINTDGQLAINNVSLTPENEYLQQQIKERLQLDTPRMQPVLSSSGTPRRVNKNYNFTLSKQ